jgi:hypothetical protein
MLKLVIKYLYSPIINFFLNLNKIDLVVKKSLRKKIKFLPDFKHNDNIQKSLLEWHDNLNQIKKNLLKYNLKRFLCWKVINNTMFFDDSLATKIEHMYLIKSDFLKNYGKKILHESSIGSPTYSSYLIKSSSNLIHHAYHLSVFEKLSMKKVKDHKTIIEFGGGYGSMCRLIYQTGYTGTYIIYDFEHFNIIQNYYLKSIGLKLNVKIVKKFTQLKKNKYIYLVSDLNVLKKILKKNSKTLFLSTWGFSECPVELRFFFINIIKNSHSLLLAFQKKFNDINNFNYFKSIFFRKKTILKKINHIKNNFYLIR